MHACLYLCVVSMNRYPSTRLVLGFSDLDCLDLGHLMGFPLRLGRHVQSIVGHRRTASKMLLIKPAAKLHATYIPFFLACLVALIHSPMPDCVAAP